MANSSWHEHLIYGTRKLRIEKYVSEGWRAFRTHFLTFFLAGIIAMVLSALSLGILGGVLFAGYAMMFVRFFRDQKTPEIEHLFQYFSRFVPLFLASLIYFAAALLSTSFRVTPFLGILVIPGIFVFALALYIIPLMIDRNLSLRDAIRQSVEMGWNRSGLLMNCIFALLLCLMMFVGAQVFLIGTFITYPLFTGTLAAAYLDLSRAEAATRMTESPSAQRREPVMPAD
ncbi:MAG: hypothetical protein HY391_00495 [Deltaproteobacteria bacterium]|nr:hypothetical protein [Deltaproteobacteria bacterium]